MSTGPKGPFNNRARATVPGPSSAALCSHGPVNGPFTAHAPSSRFNNRYRRPPKGGLWCSSNRRDMKSLLRRRSDSEESLLRCPRFLGSWSPGSFKDGHLARPSLQPTALKRLYFYYFILLFTLAGLENNKINK